MKGMHPSQNKETDKIIKLKIYSLLLVESITLKLSINARKLLTPHLLFASQKVMFKCQVKGSDLTSKSFLYESMKIVVIRCVLFQIIGYESLHFVFERHT